MGIFIISHLTAVFVLGRQAMQVDTNWDFAIGAPAGMMGDSWNVRLVPHYSLAVLLLFGHLACGVRNVLLGRRIAMTAATRTAAAIIAFGGAVAFTVTLAMLGLHVGPLESAALAGVSTIAAQDQPRDFADMTISKLARQ